MHVLLTAFEPYAEWPQNSSWLALVELLKNRPTHLELTTRRYPVELAALRKQLHEDLQTDYDAVLHLGQSPGTSAIKLEAIALNVAGCVMDAGQELPNLIESAPLAFRSQMPLARWADALRESGIPAKISYHAGTFLCNATMYLTHYWYQSRGVHRPVGFVHLPLATEQVARGTAIFPSLPQATLGRSLDILLKELSAMNAASQRRLA
ncbi:pyroglutamyl-peptidase I [Aureliella helgolandensis]|uniref:pyroglutamyl-peptidase I n=1 Tax=Aureliella helgolandensis TaxID=2527968 RepID=UPI00119CF4B1|nr:pyroglutamyl-peptidase I [Aureliella helgolandensis]